MAKPVMLGAGGKAFHYEPDSAGFEAALDRAMPLARRVAERVAGMVRRRDAQHVQILGNRVRMRSGDERDAWAVTLAAPQGLRIERKRRALRIAARQAGVELGSSRGGSGRWSPIRPKKRPSREALMRRLERVRQHKLRKQMGDKAYRAMIRKQRAADRAHEKAVRAREDAEES